MRRFFSQLLLTIKSNISKMRSNSLVIRFSKVLTVDVLVKASGFFLLPIYLRLMTQEEYGFYGYLVSIIGAFSLFLNFGLYVSQIKLYNSYENAERRSMLFTVNVLLAVFLCIVLVGAYLSGIDYPIVSFMFSHQINYANYRIFVFLSLVSSVFGLMLYSYFMASENIPLVQFNNLAKGILINAVVIYFLYIRHSDSVLVRLKYTLLSELVLLTFFSFFLIKEMRLDFRFGIAWRSLKIGIPIMLSAVFAMFYNLSDRFFLEKYVGLKVLAIYNLGLTIASVISILTTSFQCIYAPVFFKEKDPVVNLENVRKILKIAIPFMILISVGLVLASWVMIQLNIINKGYSEVVLLLPLIFIALILQGVTHLYINFMTYFEITYIIVIVNIFSNLSNVVLNIFLVPRFSIYGAAFSTIVATGMAFLLFFFYVKRRVRLSVCGAI